MPRRLAAPLAVAVGVAAGNAAVGGRSGRRPGGDPVLVGAWDIASCGRTGDEATAGLLDGIDGTVATLGDNVYENGTSAAFEGCYGPSWGRHKACTMPSVGNH